MRLLRRLRFPALAVSLVAALAVVIAGSAAGASARTKPAPTRAPRAHAAIINGVLVSRPGSLALVASDIGQCSGSVISNNVILTAAHCVHDPDSGALLDPSSFTVQTNAVHAGDPTGFFARVSRVVSYAWLPSINAGDLAVLQLSSPTPAPAMPLATSADNALLTPGTVSAAEGWGVWQLGTTAPSDDLRAGGQIVQSASYCSAQAQSAGTYINTTSTMCAIDPGGTYGGCNGDSGGPLVAKRADQSIAQTGITSFGASDCSTSHPGFYTRVDTYSSWIVTWVKFLAPPPVPTPVVVPAPAPAPAPAPVATLAQPATPPSTTAPTATPTKVTSTKFSAYTARGGYLSASVPADRLHVSWLRIGQQLRCRGGHTTYINDIFNGPSRGGWAMSATKPLKLTLSKPASRRFFRRTDTITLSPGPDGVYGSVRVIMRARATKVGTCTATVRSFRLRAPKS